MRFKEIIPAHVAERIVDAGTTCDLCGNDLAKDDGGYLANEVELSAKLGSIYPEGDQRTAYEVDVCGSCFENKVAPAIAAIGLVFRERGMGFDEGDGRAWKGELPPAVVPAGWTCPSLASSTDDSTSCGAPAASATRTTMGAVQVTCSHAQKHRTILDR